MPKHLYKSTEIIEKLQIGQGTLTTTIRRLDIWPAAFFGTNATKPRYSQKQYEQIKKHIEELRAAGKIIRECSRKHLKLSRKGTVQKGCLK